MVCGLADMAGLKIIKDSQSERRLAPDRVPEKKLLCNAPLRVAPKSKAVTEHCAKSEHDHGHRLQLVKVGDEIGKTIIGNEWSEAPLRKQPESESGDSTQGGQHVRPAARTNAGSETQESGRKNQRVESLAGYPKKGEVAEATTCGCPKQPECDGAHLI